MKKMFFKKKKKIGKKLQLLRGIQLINHVKTFGMQEVDLEIASW